MKLRSSKRNSKFSFSEIHSKAGKKYQKQNRKNAETHKTKKKQQNVVEVLPETTTKSSNTEVITKPQINSRTTDGNCASSNIKILVSTTTAVLYETSEVWQSNDEIDSDDTESEISLVCDICNQNCFSDSSQPSESQSIVAAKTKYRESFENNDDSRPVKKSRRTL